jgi:thiamine monophosphate synthase
MSVSNTRRIFLQSSAALAAGLARAASTAHPQGTGQARGQTAAPLRPAAEVQVPKMKFFNVEIGRMVLGVNPFYGFAHYNSNFASAMKEWYTQDRVCEVLHQCNRFGIDAYNYVDKDRAPRDWARFLAEGGKMHLIIQVTAPDDAATLVKNFKPLALQRQGEVVDQAYQNGTMNTVKEWCKRVRDMGVLVGVGTHKPEVIAQVEEEGWDVDFYAGCVYNRTRTADEWKKVLNGEMMEMPHDIYLQSDPPRMYKVMRQTRKPCFAFKILAAGRIPDRAVEQAFRTAFESIKPTDGVFVGMFPRVKDEVGEDAKIVHRLLVRS